MRARHRSIISQTCMIDLSMFASMTASLLAVSSYRLVTMCNAFSPKGTKFTFTVSFPSLLEDDEEAACLESASWK